MFFQDGESSLQGSLEERSGSVADDDAKYIVILKLGGHRVSLHQSFVVAYSILCHKFTFSVS